jgi:hypothetical protein
MFKPEILGIVDWLLMYRLCSILTALNLQTSTPTAFLASHWLAKTKTRAKSLLLLAI